MNVKLRFSDGDKDIKFPVNTEETVGTLKKRVFQDVRNIDVADQRYNVNQDEYCTIFHLFCGIMLGVAGGFLEESYCRIALVYQTTR